MKLAIIQRVILGFVLVIAVIVLNFLLLQAAPGDVVDAMLAEAGGGDPVLAARLRESYGLDQPVYVQLWRYLGRVLSGDLGHSFYYDDTVASLILSHLPTTLLLTESALFIAVIVGTLFGVYAAIKPRGLFSNFVTLFSLLGYATPVFWLGMFILLVFALYLPWFPAYGMRSISEPVNWFDCALDIANHLVLPTFTLAILNLANYSRISRASMLDVLGADYVRTARTKSLSEFQVIFLTRVEKCGAAGHHAGGLAAGPSVFWCGAGRDSVQSARCGSAVVRIHCASRLPGYIWGAIQCCGNDHCCQYPYRSDLSTHGSKDSINHISEQRSVADISPFQFDEPVVVAEKMWRETARLFCRNYTALFGLIVVTVFILTGLFGPILWPVDPFEPLAPPLTAPGVYGLLGTDYLGRDVFTGIIYSTRPTLVIAVAATLVTVLELPGRRTPRTGIDNSQIVNHTSLPNSGRRTPRTGIDNSQIVNHTSLPNSGLRHYHNRNLL